MQTFKNILVLLTAAFLCGTPDSFAATRIVVDAGHGGSDAGCRAPGQNEKTWNLKFAQAFSKALNDAGLDAVQVRAKDDDVSQDKRFEIINTSGASLAVIFHADRESSGKVAGPLFVVQPPQTNSIGPEEGLPEAGTIPLGRYRQSLRLARLLAGAVGSSAKFCPLSESRAVGAEGADAKGSVLAAPHQSLRYAAVPAVVVIPLFISHAEDLKKYSTDEAVAAFCKALAKGVASYLNGDGR
jgi:N-acetylmuramoyl-L-alanine amidase